MKPFTLSRRRVQLILANYFVGYLFVYPMLIGLLYSLLEPLGIKHLQPILENAVYLWVFAITVTWISLFNGYDAIPTSAGISRATTRTVVHSSLAVLGLDFVLTALMFGN